MRALVVAPNWIGDAVMAQPLLRLLKAREPQLTLDWLAPAHILPVGAAIAEIDQLIEAPQRHGQLQWRERSRTAAQIKQQAYERAYILPNSAKSALIPWLAGIPQRIGYAGAGRRLLLNRAHPTQRSGQRPAMVAHYAKLAMPPGQTLTERIPAPRLKSDPAQAAQVRQRLDIQPGPLVILAPGAEYGPAKRWPVRHFAEMADRTTLAWPDAQVVLLGSMADRPAATEIAAMTVRMVRNLCGETSLADAIALLSQANGVVSNDSGLMHIAAAFERPQAAVFGSSDPRHTPPHSARAKVLWLGLNCSPCFERECPLGHTACLNQIEPSQVFEALASAIEQKA